MPHPLRRNIYAYTAAQQQRIRNMAQSVKGHPRYACAFYKWRKFTSNEVALPEKRPFAS
jgi:hypothetical protein